MSPATRILLNTFATYGRSLIALALGLLSTRWVLKALGADDFGLYGVVGSLIVFITYLNTTLAGAVARFYAFSIGRAQKFGESEGFADLRRWFNMAVLIHTVLPMALVLIGYPLGVYAINNWLVIAPERISACIWVFRFALCSAFFSMVTVPFVAMFQAHQLIMELSVVSVVQTVVNFICAYKLLSVGYDHLIFYAFYMMLVAVCFGLVLFVWAICRFKVCRIRFDEMIDKKRLIEFFSFAGAKLFGSSCVILRTQGGCVLLNRFFLPFVNAAYTVSNQISGHTSALSQALIGALQPAIASKAGACDMSGMTRYAVSSCRVASLLVMIFIIPLSAEINEVLRLWLQDPPQYAASFCVCMLVMLLFDKMSVGYMLAANAYGEKIIVYELVLGLILVAALPLSYLCFRNGLAPYSLSVCLGATMFGNALARVAFCWWQLKMSMVKWLVSVALPIIFVSALSYAIACGVRELMTPSLLRVLIVSSVSLVVVLGFGWVMIFSVEERRFVGGFITKIKERGGK